MWTSAINRASHIAIMTENLKTIGEVMSDKPIQDTLTTPDVGLSPVSITATIDVVYAQELRSAFTAASALTSIVVKYLLFQREHVCFGSRIHFPFMALCIALVGCFVSFGMLFAPLFHIGSMFSPKLIS